MSAGRVHGLVRHVRTQAAFGFLLFKNSLLCNSTAIGLILRLQLYSGRSLDVWALQRTQQRRLAWVRVGGAATPVSSPRRRNLRSVPKSKETMH